MILTASEKATINFYTWELYSGRGYYHFDAPVEIEPRYVPFSHKNYTDDLPSIDDGRVPSIFGRIKNLLEPPKPQKAEKEEEVPQPNLITIDRKRRGFSFTFPDDQEILVPFTTSFLNLLSFTDGSLSFEILGTAQAITVQIVCLESDYMRIRSHLKAYFPTVIIKDIDSTDIGFDLDKPVAICDFGLNDEFMRPIQTAHSFAIDPLTSIIAMMEHLEDGDVALFQTLFKGVTAPWAKDIQYSVSDGLGGSFFQGNPEMLPCAQHKVSSPLFSVVTRIAVQGTTEYRNQFLAKELIRNVTGISKAEYNHLIPLSNKGYTYDNHIRNVYLRESNRLGFMLNTEELALFVHYPNRSIVSKKLGFHGGKTKLINKGNPSASYILQIYLDGFSFGA